MAIRKTNIEIMKNPNENNANVIRRFQRKVQEAGIIHQVKGKRYNERKKSKLAEKASALMRMNKRKEIEKLKKLGKVI